MKNDCKNAIRHLVCKTYEKFVQHKPSVSVLSLPGESWEFENQILDHQDYRNCIQKNPLSLQLICFEKSFRTYSVNNLLDKNKDNNTKYLNEKLNLEHLRILKESNKFYWFDFCGNPSEESLRFLNEVFKATYQAENVCAIFTFTLGWRHRDNLPKELNYVTKLGLSNDRGFKSFLNILIDKLNKNRQFDGPKITLLWEYTYISSRSPMVCFCITNDPFLQKSHALKGEGELQKPDQDVTPAAAIKNDLGAGEEMVQQMQESKRTLAANKAWVTRRARMAAAEAAVKAVQTAPENI